MKTPWTYEEVPMSICDPWAMIKNADGEIMCMVPRVAVGRLIVHAVNTVPQLHVNQIIKD